MKNFEKIVTDFIKNNMHYSDENIEQYFLNFFNLLNGF